MKYQSWGKSGCIFIVHRSWRSRAPAHSWGLNGQRNMSTVGTAFRVPKFSWVGWFDSLRKTRWAFDLSLIQDSPHHQAQQTQGLFSAPPRGPPGHLHSQQSWDITQDINQFASTVTFIAGSDICVTETICFTRGMSCRSTFFWMSSNLHSPKGKFYSKKNIGGELPRFSW